MAIVDDNVDYFSLTNGECDGMTRSNDDEVDHNNDDNTIDQSNLITSHCPSDL